MSDFHTWLKHVSRTDDQAGDLIEDMRSVLADVPNAQQIDELEAHMRSRNACTEALAALPEVWRRYQTYKV
jgi:hypothetical protein